MDGRSFRLAGAAILSPWFTVVSLALESSEVIGLRVARLARGGSEAQHEAHLILSEKMGAVFEIAATLLSGATAAHVVDRIRDQVTANARRLSADSGEA